MKRLRAFFVGLGDGWRQPRYLNTSTNVDHLAKVVRPSFEDWDHSVYDYLDRGINIGQFLRAGRKSQAWQEGYWPFHHHLKDREE